MNGTYVEIRDMGREEPAMCKLNLLLKVLLLQLFILNFTGSEHKKVYTKKYSDLSDLVVKFTKVILNIEGCHADFLEKQVCTFKFTRNRIRFSLHILLY